MALETPAQTGKSQRKTCSAQCLANLFELEELKSTLEQRYRPVAYLDVLHIEQRIRLLSDKLDLIHELLNMLADEQNHKHSATLEWIIIWLIAVEIVIFIFYDILELL